ncbi:MAG TPA: MFS transporter [Rhodocyclaceae bacterium]|nr:MFS transporter [Rhodocyclaceae bacterium]
MTSASLPAPMRALAHPAFRYYFAGQAVSILGSWIQQVALAWLVYRLTGSATLLGVTAFAALVPQLFVGPLAGAWIDRHDKRRTLVGIQFLLALQAAVLALLAWTESIGPPLIVAMSVALGVLNAFDTPLRQSLISVMVPRREDLPNALALNAMLFNLGRFIGPPVAGFLVGLTSEAACFAINAVSFAALIAGLLRMRVPPTPRAQGSVGHVFREGLRYAWNDYAIRTVLLMLTLLNLTASAYAVLLPIFAKEVFAGDARTLGLLWGAAGCGAFASTLFLAARKSLPAVVRGVAGGVFPLTTRLEVALPAMAALGFGISVCNVGVNTILQSLTPDRLRGRVISLFTAARFGFDAVGGLIAGFVAAAFGAPATLVGEGVILGVAAAWFLGHRRDIQRASGAAAPSAGRRGG